MYLTFYAFDVLPENFDPSQTTFSLDAILLSLELVFRDVPKPVAYELRHVARILLREGPMHTGV